MNIEKIKAIAKEAWIESFFTKRNTDITGFEDWWAIEEKKLLDQDRLTKAGIHLSLNSIYGTVEPESLDTMIENAGKDYWCLLPGYTDMIEEKNWVQTFVSGAKSDAAKAFWYREFLKDQL